MKMTKLRAKSFGLFAALSVAFLIATACPGVCAPVLSINRADIPPVIDGVIGDAEWSKAACVTPFIRFGKEDVEQERTVLYVAHDGSNLYVAGRFYQDESPTAVVTARDGMMWWDDILEMYIQPDPSKTDYYHFMTNFIGNRYDEKTGDANWNAEWKSAATAGKGYWDIEVAIPLSAIGITSWRDGMLMGANFCRNHFLRTAQTGFGVTSPATISSNWSRVRGRRYSDIMTFGQLNMNDRSVFARVESYTADPDKGIKLRLRVTNPTSQLVSVAGHLECVPQSGGKVVSADRDLDVAAAGSTVLDLAAPAKVGVYNVSYSVTDKKNNKVIMAQQLSDSLDHLLAVKKYWFTDELDLALDVKGFRKFAPTNCDIRLVKAGKTVARCKGKLDEGLWKGSMSTNGLAAGDYVIVANVSGKGNSAVVDRLDIKKPAKPSWFDSKLGEEDVLLSPWTPMEHKGGSVLCWGREYSFNGEALPTGIVSQGQQLLAGPVTVTVKADGQQSVLAATGQKLVESKDTRVVMKSQAKAAGMSMNAISTLEFDGMVRFDLELTSSSAKKLEALWLDIPLKKEAATLLEGEAIEQILAGSFPNWPGWPTGLAPDRHVEGPFTPYIFLGNDDAGLVWFAESRKMWANKDDNKVIEVIPEKDRTILRVHFVDYPINAKEKLALTFGLQATPVKKMSPKKKFGMYAAYNHELPQLCANGENNGRLIYTAAGNINLEKGSVHLRISPNVNLADVIVPHTYRSPRGDADCQLFSLEFPNGDRFGLYWGATDTLFRIFTRTGLNEEIREKYASLAEFKLPEWQRNQMRDISLSWNEGRVSAWMDGKKVAETEWNPAVFSEPVETARLRMGGSFIYDAIKVSADAYSGGDAGMTKLDGATLLLDTFDNVGVDGVTSPAKSVGNTRGRLDGAWYAGNGTVSIKADKRACSNLEIWRADGADLVHMHENWTESEGYPLTRKYVKEVKSLVAGCNDLGLQFLPYVGFQLGNNSPEYADYGAEVVVEPFVEECAFNRGDHLGIPISYSGRYQNFMIENIEMMLKDYGIGGLYMDGSCIPPADTNMRHGCGYYDRKGNLRPSYPIFEYRRYFKRIRTVGLKHRTNFWMDMHTPLSIWTPISSFGDSIWKGEQFSMMDRKYGGSIREIITPDCVRAGMGRQYGLQTYFLNYDQMEDCASVCVLLDMPLRLDCTSRDVVQAAFGTEDAQWHPYWKNAGKVSVSGGSTYASYWRRADGAVLLAISNLLPGGKDAVNEKVVFTPAAGILPGSIASDAVSGERLDFSNGILNISVTPWRYRLVLISPENVQPPLMPGKVWKSYRHD